MAVWLRHDFSRRLDCGFEVTLEEGTEVEVKIMKTLLLVIFFWEEDLASETEGDTWDKTRASGVSYALFRKTRSKIC